MAIIDEVPRRAARIGSLVCGYLVLAGAVIVGADVIVRKLANVSLLAGAASELCGYVLAIVTTWGAASALLARAHIRIDLLANMLPPRAAAVADMVAVAAFAFATGFLTWTGYGTAMRSFELGSRSMSPLAVPLALPQGAWLAGLFLLTLTALFILLRGLVFLIAGDHAAVRRLAGPKTSAEEVDEQRQVVTRDTESRI